MKHLLFCLILQRKCLKMPEDFILNIHVRIIDSASIDDLKILYKDAGWWEPVYDENPEFLNQIVKNSSVFAGAFLRDRLIGMGRALSDLASDAYIQDVAVLKEYRGNGIGKKIIRVLLSTLKDNKVDWIGLIAQPGTEIFYEELGFEKLKNHVPFKYKG